MCADYTPAGGAQNVQLLIPAAGSKQGDRVYLEARTLHCCVCECVS